MNKLLSFSFIVLLAALVSSCSSCQNNEDGKGERKVKETITSGVIDISCDESFEPIMEQEITVFEAAYPKASIIPYYVSEAEALNMLLQDSVRLAVATRKLTPQEEASFKSRQLRVRTVQIALDGIAFIVNKNNKHDVISVDELRKIVTGEATAWNQIYPGSSLGKINFVFDNQGSSSMRYAIDSTKLQRELGWEPSLQFEEGIEKTVRWYLDNQEWMDNVTSGDYQRYYEEMYKGK